MAEHVVITIPKMEDKKLTGGVSDRIQQVVTAQGHWLIQFTERHNELVDEVARDKADAQVEIDERVDGMMKLYHCLDRRIGWMLLPWHRRLWKRLQGEKIPQ